MNVEKLAGNLVDFYEAYDTYDFNDNYENKEVAFKEILANLYDIQFVKDLIYRIDNILYEFDLEGINNSQFKVLYGNTTPRPDKLKYDLEELLKDLNKEVKEEGEELNMSRLDNLARDIATIMDWDDKYDFSQYETFETAVEEISNNLNKDVDPYLDYFESLISDLEYDGIFNKDDFKVTFKLNIDPFTISTKLENIKKEEVNDKKEEDCTQAANVGGKIDSFPIVPQKNKKLDEEKQFSFELINEEGVMDKEEVKNALNTYKNSYTTLKFEANSDGNILVTGNGKDLLHFMEEEGFDSYSDYDDIKNALEETKAIKTEEEDEFKYSYSYNDMFEDIMVDNIFEDDEEEAKNIAHNVLEDVKEIKSTVPLETIPQANNKPYKGFKNGKQITILDDDRKYLTDDSEVEDGCVSLTSVAERIIAKQIKEESKKIKTESEEQVQQGQVPDETYVIADAIEEKIKDKDFISKDDFDAIVEDTIKEKEFVDYEDFEADVRGILSMRGWSTNFNTGDIYNDIWAQEHADELEEACGKKKEPKKNESKLEEDYVSKELTDKYLPPTGDGENLAETLITAINRLDYRWYNDGEGVVVNNELFGEDWGGVTRNTKLLYVMEEILDNKIHFDGDSSYDKFITSARAYINNLPQSKWEELEKIDSKDILDKYEHVEKDVNDFLEEYWKEPEEDEEYWEDEE